MAQARHPSTLPALRMLEGGAMSEKVKPVVTKNGDGWRDETETHPAYMLIGAARVGIGSGGKALYGSDFVHNSCVRVTLSRSVQLRTNARDWHASNGQVISVYLSEAQWATFVSTLNIGEGVPCTLDWKEGEGYAPEIARDRTQRDRFKADVARRMERAREHLRALVGMLSTRKQREAAEAVERELLGNLPWVAQQFDEHMEETVEKAKGEVHAYVMGVVHRAGLSAIAAAPLELEAPREEGDE